MQAAIVTGEQVVLEWVGDEIKWKKNRYQCKYGARLSIGFIQSRL